MTYIIRLFIRGLIRTLGPMVATEEVVDALYREIRRHDPTSSTESCRDFIKTNVDRFHNIRR